MISLILGSASPRRKEILSLFNIPFRVVAPNVDEDSHPFRGDPAQYVSELSVWKSEAIKVDDANDFVLTADTIVYRDGKVYGKPKDRADAFRILTDLNGKSHTVYTGVSLRKGNVIETLSGSTEVFFDLLSPDELKIYLNKVHWQDKAGAYAIQDEGALLIKGINGCYYNVKGLPLGVLKILFLKFKIDLWNFLK